MANQRKAGKKKVNVWLTDAEKSALEKAAKERGMTLTDFLKWVASLGGKIGVLLFALHYFTPVKTAAALKLLAHLF